MKFFWSQLTEDSAHSEQEKVDYSAYSKDELLDHLKRKTGKNSMMRIELQLFKKWRIERR